MSVETIIVAKGYQIKKNIQDMPGGKHGEYMAGIREANQRQKKVAQRLVWKFPTEAPQLTEEQQDMEKEKQLAARYETARTRLENQKIIITPEQLESYTAKLASLFQEEWKKTSGYKIRFKDIRMSEYPNTPEGDKMKHEDETLVARAKSEYGDKYRNFNDKGEPADQIDIQNLAYDQLSNRWKDNNRLAAKFITELVNEELTEAGYLSPEFYEYAAARVHVAWLKRQGAFAGPDQKVLYHKMNTKNKNKDREHVVLATELLVEFINRPIPVETAAV